MTNNEFSIVKCRYEKSISSGGGTFEIIYGTKQLAVAGIHINDGYILIQKLCVENEYRGLGLGSKLMHTITDWCENNGIFAATVNVRTNITEESIEKGVHKGIPRSELKYFYRKFGFTEEKGDLLHRDFGIKSNNKPEDVFWR